MTEPTDLGRQIREQMEKMFIDGVNQMVRSTEALRQVGTSLETSLDAKQRFDAQTRQGLEMMNLPTRDDMGRVLTYLQRLESRLLDVDEKLDAIVDVFLAMRAAAQATPPPPSATTVEPKNTEPPVKKAEPVKPAAVKAPAKKAEPKKPAAAKAPTKKAEPKKPAASKAPVKKAESKKSAATKAPAKKVATKKASRG